MFPLCAMMLYVCQGAEFLSEQRLACHTLHICRVILLIAWSRFDNALSAWPHARCVRRCVLALTTSHSIPRLCRLFCSHTLCSVVLGGVLGFSQACCETMMASPPDKRQSPYPGP